MKTNNSNNSNASHHFSAPLPLPEPVHSAPNGMPDANRKVRPSAVWQLGKLTENIFSHKGVFWVCVVGAIACLLYNTRFYARLFYSFGWLLAVAVVVGFLVSFGTTLFEVKPEVKKHSRKHALRRIYQAGQASQGDLPYLNPKVVSNADQILERYRNVDRVADQSEATTRWVMIAFEICVGIIFLGNVGVGLGAVMSLLMFVVSIFGCEKFVLTAIRAYYEELPPHLAQQLDETINNWGKQLITTRP